VKKARVEEMLTQVGLTGRAKDKIKTYSNGMKQRLLIARALLHQPKVTNPPAAWIPTWLEMFVPSLPISPSRA